MMSLDPDTDRPYRTKRTEELREIVESLRGELSHRTTPSAKGPREEIDPEYSIDRPHDCCAQRRHPARQIISEKNPDAYRPGLYVGSTWMTPEMRFAQHNQGNDNSHGECVNLA